MTGPQRRGVIRDETVGGSRVGHGDVIWSDQRTSQAFIIAEIAEPRRSWGAQGKDCRLLWLRLIGFRAICVIKRDASPRSHTWVDIDESTDQSIFFEFHGATRRHPDEEEDESHPNYFHGYCNHTIGCLMRQDGPRAFQ